MSELASLSLARAGLPRFPGATLETQLAAGRAAALDVLRRYRPDLVYDPVGAESVLAKVEVWEERHRVELDAAMLDPASERLPEAVKLAFNSDVAQAFVIAGFTRAAAGLGPWASGAVAREAAAGTTIQDRWAREDAEHRLQVFGGIVKMEEDGYLRTLFVPPAPPATAGLGALPAIVVWAVVVAVVAVAALVLVYFYSSRRLAENNRLMRDLCEKAQRDGDQATVTACIEATRDLQAEGMFGGLGASLFKLGAIAVAVWAGVTFLPKLWRKERP